MSAERENLADELVDQLVATDLDWRDLVHAYPKTSLALAAVGGFALGRARGTTIVAALATYTADTLAHNINEFLGDEVL
ncbi:MAG: hypothetical protein ACE5EG_04500 [Thermoanaerobaculia bacterium]